MNNKNSQYRKINDRTQNSYKYHKKDCTNVRAKLKEELKSVELEEVVDPCYND